MSISPTTPIQNASITAEVVGVFQKEEKPVTTLLIKPFTIEVDEINDAHLGDEATIEITFLFNSINFQPIPRRQK
ncbi:MAG: hypothetical protein Q8L88_10100 [Bacteroidota bacterium]|nr:hypothetical protein [Bacteroidota bacterium]